MDEQIRWKVGPTIVYAREPFPTQVQKTLFLAGPTPRSAGQDGWREEALRLLQEAGFDGHVFVPEPRDGSWLSNYDEQIEWEEEGLHRADIILFWVPRDPDGTIKGEGKMAAFTTNVEWGEWKDSGKVVFGAPDWAQNVRYLEYYARKLGVPTAKDLETTIMTAIQRLGAGAERHGGECCIPLHIWKRKDFTKWITCQKKAGNRLDGARVQWAFFPRPGALFCYAVHVNVFIAVENRNKPNEVFLARSDTSSVLLYCPPAYDPHQGEETTEGNDLDDFRIALVREFRSTVVNEECFVYELASGSSVNELENPLGVAASEVEEEMGLKLDYRRFERHETRQLMATFSTHSSSLFSCELTPEEMDQLAADKSPHGNHVTDTEMTHIEVRTVREIRDQQLMDWSTLGMILSVLAQ